GRRAAPTRPRRTPPWTRPSRGWRAPGSPPARPTPDLPPDPGRPARTRRTFVRRTTATGRRRWNRSAESYALLLPFAGEGARRARHCPDLPLWCGAGARPLGELEDGVMTRVWKWDGPVTVREGLEDLQKERSIAYTTVMTVLDNLHQKGWVRREAEGRAYRYEAVSTRAAYAAALMNDAWSQSDNAAAALVAFFGMMSEEQRQALTDAIRVVRIPESAEQPSPAEPARPTEPEPAGPA